MMNSILEPSNFIKYHKSLKLYLGISQDKLTPITSARVAKAREKLSRLTEIQFYDLSTDVYDELQRRINETNEKPKHLLPQSNYHPKRNQARQKLAALPSQRFKDLVNDVLFEIDRRHLAEQPSIERSSMGSPNLNDYPSARESSQQTESKRLSLQRSEQSLSIQEIPKLHIDSPFDDLDDANEVKTPVRENFQQQKVETPSQREIKATKVVPKRAELTWSSDEEEEDALSNDASRPGRISIESREMKNRATENKSPLTSNHNSLTKDTKIKEDYEEKLKAKDDIIQGLNEQLTSLRENIELNEQKVSNLESELLEKDSNMKSLKEESSKFSELEVTNAEQLNKIAELQDQLHKAIPKVRELDDLKGKYKELQEKYESADREINSNSNDLNDKVSDLEKQNKLLQEESESQKRSYQELQKKHEQLSRQHSLLQKDHTALQKTMEDIPMARNGSSTSLKRTSSEIPDSVWQKKFQELKADKISDYIISAKGPDVESLQRYCDLDGSVPLIAVANLYAGVEMMLSYISEEKISTFGLFNGVSGIAAAVRAITKDAGSTDPTSAVGEKTQLIEASLSNLLTSTRYYALYLDVMPKLLMHAAISDVYFSVLDLTSLRKIHAVGDTLIQAIKDSRSRTEQSLQEASNQKAHELTQSNLQSRELNSQKNEDPLASLPDYIHSGNLPDVPKFDGDGSDASTPPRTPTEEETLTQVKPLRMAERLSSQEDLTKRSTSDGPRAPRNFKRPLPTISPIQVHSPRMRNIYQDKNSTMEKASEKPLTVQTISTDRLADQSERPVEVGKEAARKDVERKESAKKQPVHLSKISPTSSAPKAINTVPHLDHHTINKKPAVISKSQTPVRNSPPAANVSVSSLASKFSEISSNESTPHSIGKAVSRSGSTPRSSKINKFKQRFEQNDAESLKHDSFISSSPSGSPSPVKYHSNGGEVAKAFDKFGARVNSMDRSPVSKRLFTDEKQDDDASDGDSEESEYDTTGVEAKIETVRKIPQYEQSGTESDLKVPEPKPRYIQGSGSTDEISNSNQTRAVAAEVSDEEASDEESKKEESKEVDIRQEDKMSDDNDAEEKKETPMRATTEEEEENFDFENFNTLDPDNTLKELLLYLEHQTVEVISAIQQLLQSIRNPKATRGLLRGAAELIITVVKQMCEGTKTLMSQSRYADAMGHAQYVVDVLDDCVIRMDKLYGKDHSKDVMYADKDFKQRSAGIAFDIARSTKELVKTVEEASLRDEIAVIDSRLNAPSHA